MTNIILCGASGIFFAQNNEVVVPEIILNKIEILNIKRLPIETLEGWYFKSA